MKIETPMFNAFEDWVEKGFSGLSDTQLKQHTQRSWRFWARGDRKDGIIAGLVKDSSDAIGRPFPLLMMGQGVLYDWEKKWGVIPSAFEDLWQEMEQKVSKRMDDMDELEKEIGLFSNPFEQWQKTLGTIQCLEYGNEGKDKIISYDEISVKHESLRNNGEVWILLDHPTLKDKRELARHWILKLSSQSSHAPSAVFLGGKPEKPALIIFSKSLKSDDFFRLWSKKIEE